MTDRLPTVEEMNKRVMRNGKRFKVYAFCEEIQRWIGARKTTNYDWVIASWGRNGIYGLDKGEIDLIEPIEEWHEDVYLARRDHDGYIHSTGCAYLPSDYLGWSCSKERRHYKKENGVVKFIRSEVIE